MSLNTSVVTAMRADPDIAALVGTKIYLLQMPQDLKATCMTFWTEGDVPNQTHGGLSVLKSADLTINLWSPLTGTLEQLKAAALNFWNGYEGAMGDQYVTNAVPMIVGTDYDDLSGLYRYVMLIELNLRN